MITHIVIMKPRADLAPGEREAFVEAFEHAVSEISAVRAVRIGRRVTHGAQYEQSSPAAADFLVQIDFDLLDTLKP